MKIVKLTIILVVFSILFGCQTNEASNQHSDDDQPPFHVENFYSSPVTFLFSNDERIEEEASYYDALLTFQRKYPGQLSSVKIVSTTEKQLAEYYDIIVYPTLLVIDEFGIKMRIEGFKETNEIFSMLEDELVEIIEDIS
ncbi:MULTISPECIES: hypothetical protein [Bacillaceae]|uniref:Small peptidoglycan-associated lipoprotein n=1 Tax=Evansella alkalicola TaxID=745819 RepID=A0ABS6JPY9_9BACI|nr:MULTISPECIES: hypothetical protein [Bacillaceae]MBU9720505.1 hypothetical protein [Bacillus alkalicola]